MKNGVKGSLLLVLLLILAVLIPACSSFSAEPPTDEEIVKAIDDSGVMKRDDGKISIVPPAKVVEKGKRNKDGSWPVKVKFTVVVKMPDGRTSPPSETTTTFKIFRAKDEKGNKVWKAQMGS